MTGQGIKARTDAGESGAMAWSGAPWLWPTAPPCAALTASPDTAAERMLSKHVDGLKGDVLQAAQRAAERGSDRARVLLQNYWPTVERLLGNA